MAVFVDSYTALAYLNTGDVASSMLVLRASTEANLLEADKYGDWQLWVHNSHAMSKWFSGYERLRANLPETTRGPVDAEFDRRLDEVLKKAAAKVNTDKQRSGG